MRSTTPILLLAVLTLIAACEDDDTPASEPKLLTFAPLSWDTAPSIVTDMAFLPDDTLIVIEKTGLVGHYAIEGDTARRLGAFTIREPLSTDDDCGLLSVAVDPDFSSNGFLYIGHCISRQGSTISRFTVSASFEDTAATRAEIITVEDSAATVGWHNVGSMHFDDDGVLWALFGDKRVNANGQDFTNNRGALIRIIPDRTPNGSGYTAAGGNLDGGDVYAYGLRSPWKGTLDDQGRFWIGDVGEDTFEEVNLARSAGQNFGWDRAEGPCTTDCEGLTDPLLAFGHGPDEDYIFEDADAVPTPVRSVWVGPQLGAPYGSLSGGVLFGDFCVGFVRLARADGEGVVSEDRHVGHFSQPTGWAKDSSGRVYVAQFGLCEARDIDPDNPPTTALYRVDLSAE